MRARPITLLLVPLLLAAGPAGAQGQRPAAEDPLAGQCPPSLGADPATPPTLRVGVLWRQPSLAEQFESRRAGANPPVPHPSMARNFPGIAAEAQKNPRTRLELANWDAGIELLAGRHEAAQRRIDACLADAAAQRDAEAEAACANNLGVSLAARGRYADAQAQFERAARRYQDALAELKARPPETLPLPVPREMLASMTLMARMGAEMGAVRVAQNQGQLALAMGQLAPAERHLADALQAAAGLPAACRAAPAADLARLYRRLNRGAEADALLARHPSPRRKAGSTEEEGLSWDMGRVALAPSASQAPTTAVAAPARASGAALSISTTDEPLSIGSEAALQSLLAAAGRDEQAGRADAALAGYTRAALRAQAVRRPEAELAARSGLMRVHAAAGRPGAAIAQGKQAVRLVQQLHQGDGGTQLDRATRRTLLRQRQQVHAQAVQLLLERQRLAEAEQVLQMLKQDEGLQFTGARAEGAPVRLPDSGAEQALWARHEQAAAELRRLDGERRALAESAGFKMLLNVDRATIERARLAGAADVLAFLNAPATSTLEAELRRQPAEARPWLQRLMAGKGEALAIALRRVAEDAPQFTEARPGAAQLASLNEAARRAGEFHAAFGPVYARLQAEPARTGNDWLGSRSPAPPTAATLAASMAQAGARVQDLKANAEGLQKAMGVVIAAYMGALTGSPGAPDAAAVEAALKGLPPEALGTLAVLARQQATQMAGRMGTPSAANAARLQDVQRQIDAALQRGRPAPAAAPAPAKASGLDEFEAALLFLDPAERAWRLDQARERAEAAFVAADRAAWPALEAPAAPPAADDSVATLARQAPNAALLHFLPGEARTDVLLVTARGRQALQVALPRAQLDAQIARLQELLRESGRDPRPVARALHDALVAPLQPALEAAGVQVLVLSLHDRLRFVPFAALHDGQRWLVERYAVVVHPGARLADLLRPTSPRWRVAAFGASAGGAGLPALPAVPAEVRSVTGAGSASPRGQAWIDQAFDARALRAALAGQHQVLHIASHFVFQGGSAAESFLLLGDGGRLSLRELGSPEYRFDRLELVTLSACQTGLSQDDAYGQEVDGLGALLMAQGARAVLASLWQVNDESTGQLMSSLYGLRERDAAAPVPLALALQQAQLAMIRGAPGGADTSVASRGAGRRVEGETLGAGWAGKSHPHHWAPFVLMGNWR